MRLSSYVLMLLVAGLANASAAVVYITVSGTAIFGLTQGQAMPPELGNRQFIAHYSYEDSVTLNTTSGRYEDALLSFNLAFTNGMTVTATGGDMTVDPGGVSISVLDNETFPTLSGVPRQGLFFFKLQSTDGSPILGRLPSAEELTSGYGPWFTWIGYGGDPNRFMLVHNSFTAVPEAGLSMLVPFAASFFLCFRRRMLGC